MASHYLTVGARYGFAVSILIYHIFPAYLVAHLGAVLVVFLGAVTLAVYEQFHLVCVGICCEGELGAGRAVPVVALSVVAGLHSVPHDGFFRLCNGNMHHGLFRFEERTHVISLWLGFEGDVKHSLRPALCRPSLAFSEIVDGSPIGKSYNFVKFHGKEVFTHCSHRRLALVEVHPWESLRVAWEIHIPIIISLYVCHLGKVARQ